MVYILRPNNFLFLENHNRDKKAHQSSMEKILESQVHPGIYVPKTKSEERSHRNLCTTSVTIWMPNGAEDITRVKEGLDVRKKTGNTDAAAEMEMGRAYCQNAPSAMDAANDNVGPENRTTKDRETKDEVGRQLQKDNRDTVVHIS